MGEKLLAQRALALLRDDYGRSSREADAALEWARDHREWLWKGRALRKLGNDGKALTWDLLADPAQAFDATDVPVALFDCIAKIASRLELEAFDRDLLTVVAAFERLPRLTQLRGRLTSAGVDTVNLFGRLAGAVDGSVDLRVRQSTTVTLGLLTIDREYQGPVELRLKWRFAQLLDEAFTDEDRLIAALIGIRQTSVLERADFVEQAEEFDLLTRLLTGALKKRARGINVLIHGPPGTGKTEFARALSAAVGARLFAVGETDNEGDEPSRAERLDALNRAQRLLAKAGDSLLLFDELEDLFAEPIFAVDGARRSRSKIFINRLLENAAVPVIWTSNSLDIDAAHLRRMSFVLRMDYPCATARRRVASRAADQENASCCVGGLDALLEHEREAASVARVALRGAALAGNHPEDAAKLGTALIEGLRGGRRILAPVAKCALDLSLYDGGRSIEALVEQITAKDAPADVSLLLSGPPGTGKTALAAHIARRLDRPLAVKRASDLLSKWVGQTEANIAGAFSDARQSGAVLLFDEADSLLTDRSDARTSWEVTQVNELLTWMDSHPLPFIAATNFVRRLDPAVFRRFVFKIELQALSPEAAVRAFELFFDCSAPAKIAELRGLTPGDFAVVQRQLRYGGLVSADDIFGLLKEEADAKPSTNTRIGF